MSRQRSRVYGRSLQELFKDEGGGLPAVLKQSLRFLNSANGLTTPALFRLTGDGKKAQLIRAAWDQGKDPLRVTTDAFAVAAALRLWLANLPDSVIPCALYMTLMDVERSFSGQQKTAALQMCLRQVPVYAVKVLYPLLEFLHHYRLNQRRANTPASDLASTFAPLLLRPPDGFQRCLEQKEEESRLAGSLTDTLISEYRTLFSQRTPLGASMTSQAAPATRISLTCKTKEQAKAQPSESVDSEIESLVGILVLDSTTDVLFNSDDLPFAQAMSTSFSSSSWSSLHSELSSSDCSSPESNFSQDCLSPSSDDSLAACLDGDELMEWDGSDSPPALDCSDQALAPFFDESDTDGRPQASFAEPCQSNPMFLSTIYPRVEAGAHIRTIPVNLMTTEQIMAEKMELKSQLAGIKTWFESVSGRSLRKRDKENLRPIFVRYHRLKRALRRRRSMPIL
eukprot:jgi/Botrbrau1/6301/Bobra.0339s0012.1